MLCRFLFFLIALSCLSARGQSLDPYANLKLEQPLSPTAAEFSKYGEITVNALAGIPDINIPLYEIVAGDIKVPLKLNYNAAGIKVNQVATWVGLGWVVSGSGVIFRTVRGLPDNHSQYGWIDDKTDSHTINNSSDFQLRMDYADLYKDPAPDFYKFVLPTHSGSFIYRKSISKFETIPYEQTDIRWDSYYSVDNSSFVITTDDGFQYEFTCQQQARPGLEDPKVPNGLQNYTQAWYLTRIISGSKKDTVDFLYRRTPNYTSNHGGNVTVSPDWLISKTVISPYSSLDGDPLEQNDIKVFYRPESTVEPILEEIRFRNGNVKFIAGKARMDYPGPLLENIVVNAYDNNKAEVPLQNFKFNYSYFRSSFPNSQYDYRLKLDSITKKDIKNESEGEVHRFLYNESIPMPSTSSTAIDYWGYYNGRDMDFLPNVKHTHPDLFQRYRDINIGHADRSADEVLSQVGMLQTIVYPTKGRSDFAYEANMYKSETLQSTPEYNYALPQTRVTSVSKSRPITKTFEFEWGNDNERDICNYHLFFSPHLEVGPFDVSEIQHVIVSDVTTGVIMLDIYRGLGREPLPNMQSYQKDGSMLLTPGHRYKVNIVCRDEPGKVYVEFSMWGVKRASSSTIENIKKGGGLRIKQIKSFDIDNKLVKLNVYEYPSFGNSGRSDQDFNKCYFEEVRMELRPEPFFDCWRGIFQRRFSIVYVGKAEVPQVKISGSPIVYSFVDCITLDGEGDIVGKTTYTCNVPGLQWTSFYSPKVPGEREYIDNNFGGNLPGSYFHYAYNKNNGKYVLVESVERNYQKVKGALEPVCNIWRTNKYPEECPDGSRVGSIDDFRSIIYSLNLGAYKLTSEMSKKFDIVGDSLMSQIKKYQYDNSIHLLPTKISMVNSQGREMLEYTKYPQDFDTGEYGASLLKSHHIYNYALNKDYYIKDRLVKREKVGYKYENAIVPEYYSVDNGSDAVPSQLTTFTKYNQRGNVIEFIKNDAPATSVLWGYRNMYPIAIIRNLKYQDLSNLLVGSGKDIYKFSEEFNPSNMDVDNFLNPLQKSSILFSTQYYNPLIGINQLRKENGLSDYFQYDGFDRLLRVLDKDKRIQIQYEYNFKK